MSVIWGVSDPWAGLIASCGSFFPMVHQFPICRMILWYARPVLLCLCVISLNRMDIISTIKHFFHEFITFKYRKSYLWIINLFLNNRIYILIILSLNFHFYLLFLNSIHLYFPFSNLLYFRSFKLNFYLYCLLILFSLFLLSEILFSFPICSLISFQFRNWEKRKGMNPKNRNP